jgi:hypothetical protein
MTVIQRSPRLPERAVVEPEARRWCGSTNLVTHYGVLAAAEVQMAGERR